MTPNRYKVLVASCHRKDSHAWLSLARTRLAARRWEGLQPGQRVTIRIRPEDVLLCEGHPGRISARNVMPGHVRRVEHGTDGVRVTVDVGFPLVALITRAAAKELRLQRGTAVYAIVKATVVVPEEKVSASFRVSLVGKGAILDYDKIDFLRAVSHAGSLSSAARELHITYRTAWMWAQGINRAWKIPLLARAHGGTGGGGTSLTPTGSAVLELAAELESTAGVERRRH